MRKILLIHHCGLIGGAGKSLYYTWKSLEGKFNVVTYVPDNPPGLRNFLRSKGLNPKTFPFKSGQIPYYSGGSHLLKPSFWYHSFRSFFQISFWKKVISEEKPDLVIVNSKVLCWMGKLFKKTKSICFVRETIPGSPNGIMNKIMRNMLEDFTSVAFLSEYDLDQTKLKKAKAVVSPDFLNVEDYEDKLGREDACKQLNISPDSFNVIFVGGIDRLKGIDLAIKALELLKGENISLVVAGNDIGDISDSGIKRLFIKMIKRKSTHFSKEIKNYIKEKGMENKIRFIGVQNDMCIPFSAADVLIFPMKQPHQARPAFEIGVQHKPVIITDFPNIREFVKDDINGVTFEPDNPEALAHAIIMLKNNKALLKRLGDCNYEYTIRYHTEEYAMGVLTDEIARILK